MANKEELEYVKKWRTASAAGALPLGGITMYGCFRKINEKYPVAGDKMRGRAIAGSILFSMFLSGSMYMVSWWQGMVADADRLPRNSQLRKALRPNENLDGVDYYPSKEEAAISLGYKPEFAESDVRVTGIAAEQVKLNSKLDGAKAEDVGLSFKKE